MRSFLHNNGLTLVLLALFLITWVAQAISGWCDYNGTRVEHGRPAVAFIAYLGTGHFLEATGENWESEFLQMAFFVAFTACLFQKGSPESNDPDAPEEPEPPVTERSPWMARAGGLWLALYRRSLVIVFLALFALSFALHAAGGYHEYNADRTAHAQAAVGFLSYIGSSRFWFESFQNWQSEFLSLVAMVYLSVYLRQRGSSQSKPVAAAHAGHGK